MACLLFVFVVYLFWCHRLFFNAQTCARIETEAKAQTPPPFSINQNKGGNSVEAKKQANYQTSQPVGAASHCKEAEVQRQEGNGESRYALNKRAV